MSPGKGSMAVPKIPAGQVSRLAAKRQRRTEEAAAMRECYTAVDARDEGRCRVCGARGNPYATTLLDRLHRHHLVYRSLGGQHETACVISLCAKDHDLEHQHQIRLSGDADTRDEMGRLSGVCVEVLTESGWKIDRWV